MIASIKEMTESMRSKGSVPDQGLPYAIDTDAIATLAGGIAHQFNNALVAIVGSIDLLQLDLSGSPEVEKYAKNMRSAVKKMTRLTDQLLAYARRGNYQPMIISLNEVVEMIYPEIVRGMSPDIRLEKDLGPDLPEVLADPGQLQMVISALVENSKEAMAGQGCIRIATREEVIGAMPSIPGQRVGRCACLHVTDTGKGMSEDIKGRMFEPFFTTKVMGRGLSMAAVYGIVKNHNGWIGVDSEPGIGTTVRISLPAAVQERQQ
jgi:signal transduction histidine kinase